MSLHLTCIPITLKSCVGSTGTCILSAEVTAANTVVVTFSNSPGGTLNGGVTYTIDGGAATAFSRADNLSGNEVTYTKNEGPFSAGQVVHWLYTPGNITCGGSVIDEQDLTAVNSL